MQQSQTYQHATVTHNQQYIDHTVVSCSTELTWPSSVRFHKSKNLNRATLYHLLWQVVTRLDYCNSHLAGCTKQLIDKLLNCVAQVTFKGSSQKYETSLQCNHLHWLWMRQHIHVNYVSLYDKRVSTILLCTHLRQVCNFTTVRCNSQLKWFLKIKIC